MHWYKILRHVNGGNPFHYATMWSAAALANLAASYCNTESGHCYWYYDTEVSDVVLYGAHDDEDAENTTTVITQSTRV